MKILASGLAAASLLFASVSPVFAGYEYRSRTCYKDVYREEYIPGNRWRSGYVRTWTEQVSIPCRPRRIVRRRFHPPVQTDNNSCIEGSVLGAIAGGGLGAAASRGNGRLWAIPAGIVGGALIGCQIDGG